MYKFATGRIAAFFMLAMILGLAQLVAVAASTAPPAAERGSPVERPAIQWPEPEQKESLLMEWSESPANTGFLTVGSDASCDFSSLSDALDAASNGDIIVLTKSGDYLGQTYTLQNFHGQLTILGGYESCDSNERAGRTKLDANWSGRLFNISRANSFSGPLMAVRLKDIELSRGNAAANAAYGGGGLLINGPPGLLYVQLENVWVTDNRTDWRGGGIHVRMNASRAGGLPMLAADNDSLVKQNSAGEDGGGIACSTNGYNPGETATLIHLGAGSILNNQADRHGGGMFLEGCRNVFVYGGQRDYPFATFMSNIAGENGGGIAVTGGAVATVTGDSDSDGVYGDAEAAARIAFNEAGNGGGAWVSGEDSSLFLDDVILEENHAQGEYIIGGGGSGGGAYVSDSGFLGMRRLQDEPCGPPSFGNYPRCSRIVGNTRAGISSGIAMGIKNGGNVWISRTEITGHLDDKDLFAFWSSSPSSRATGFFEGVLIHNNLISNGSYESRVFALTNYIDLTIGWSTIAENDFSQAAVKGGGVDSQNINILGSIIYNSTHQAPIVAWSPEHSSAAQIDCVIGHQDIADLDAALVSYYSKIDPGFVDPENGDFHLVDNSPAIDYCNDWYAPQYRDLDGNERGVPHTGPTPITPPDYIFDGTFDLGAYEVHYQAQDKIFSDRFEGN